MELTSNRIVIDDIEADVLGEMLNYIYTGKEVPEKMIPDLFMAAKKYALVGLQSMCETILTQSIYIDSVADIFLLAERVSHERLRKKALSYLIKNIREVVETESWKRVQRIDEKLCLEVLNKSICENLLW
ncbi:speckle-type POZ protein-like [Musca autumnalis]|uniref:speckle-type POZ protein-like n=1 Tax=Musca autumnalis TaxID=221902 RepID=UPI003CEB2692